jgi:hypothetical protein
MSNVKIWIRKITKPKLELLKKYKNIIVYDVTKKTYDQICRIIFKNYFKNDIVLIGSTRHELPIPSVHKKFNSNDINRILRSTTTATFGMHLKKPVKIGGNLITNYTGDTFKLWSKSHLLKIHWESVDQLFMETFKTNDINSIKAWGIRLKDIEKFPEHYKRLLKADLSYPIYMYHNVILDGFHRLIKAKMMGLKRIKAYQVPARIMKFCYIVPKDLRKYRGNGFIVNKQKRLK